jgi:hypothetical protein
MNTATAITIAALAALTPTVVCLIGIILQRQDTRDLRTHTDASITALRAEMHSDLNSIRADMKQFFAITGKLDGRLDEISKR